MHIVVKSKIKKITEFKTESPQMTNSKAKKKQQKDSTKLLSKSTLVKVLAKNTNKTS